MTQETEARGKRLGFIWIATKECGRYAVSCWDDVQDRKFVADTVADCIKRGLRVERIERFENDPFPDPICRECRGKPCREASSEGAPNAQG